MCRSWWNSFPIKFRNKPQKYKVIFNLNGENELWSHEKEIGLKAAAIHLWYVSFSFVLSQFHGLYTSSLACKRNHLLELQYNHSGSLQMATKLNLIVFSIVMLHHLISVQMHVSNVHKRSFYFMIYVITFLDSSLSSNFIWSVLNFHSQYTLTLSLLLHNHIHHSLNPITIALKWVSHQIMTFMKSTKPFLTFLHALSLLNFDRTVLRKAVFSSKVHQ